MNEGIVSTFIEQKTESQQCWTELWDKYKDNSRYKKDLAIGKLPFTYCNTMPTGQQCCWVSAFYFKLHLYTMKFPHSSITVCRYSSWWWPRWSLLTQKCNLSHKWANFWITLQQLLCFIAILNVLVMKPGCPSNREDSQLHMSINYLLNIVGQWVAILSPMGNTWLLVWKCSEPKVANVMSTFRHRDRKICHSNSLLSPWSHFNPICDFYKWKW